MRRDIKTCPFCGGGKDSHEDWCFILMCLVNEEQAMFGNKRLFTEEELDNAWNQRNDNVVDANDAMAVANNFYKRGYENGFNDGVESQRTERTCKLERVDRVALIYDLSCGHKAHEDIPNFCPTCGANVVGD